MNEQLKEIIKKIKDARKYNILSPREMKILEYRFGFDDGITHTLEEVGKVFNITRERVRQIQAKALEKLRSIDKKLDI